MNRDHQTKEVPNLMKALKESLDRRFGDSTPPATPVEPRFHEFTEHTPDPSRDDVMQALMALLMNERLPNGSYVHLVHCNTSRNEPVGCAGCSCPIGRHLKSHSPAVSGEGERLNLEVLEYQIAGGGPLDRDDVRLVRRRNREGVSRWAVVNRGMALTAEGEWEWEPIPSSRTDEYLARTRFQTPEAALAVYKRRASTPTPGAPR